MIEFVDMPKLECPFEKDDEHIIIPEIKEEYRWVFTKESIAVVKIHGTCVSVWIRNGRPYAIMNRTEEIDIWKKRNLRFLDGVINAIESNYLKPSIYPDGPYFGELIGPKLQGNPYHLDKYLWVPFSYLRRKYYYKFWDGFIKEEIEGKSDEKILENISNLFKSLWCIYKLRWGLQKELGEFDSVNENSKFYNSMAAEGIVFYRRGYEDNYSRCCKLRRDQFSWYSGERHKK